MAFGDAVERLRRAGNDATKSSLAINRPCPHRDNFVLAPASITRLNQYESRVTADCGKGQLTTVRPNDRSGAVLSADFLVELMQSEILGAEGLHTQLLEQP